MKQRTMLVLLVLIGVFLGTILSLIILQNPNNVSGINIPASSEPQVHNPPFLGTYSFIVGSGNLFQNGTAYSYIRINASSIRYGDTFTVFPALNIRLQGNGINANNLTAKMTFLGSAFGSGPEWVNFSVSIPVLNFTMNFSQESGIFSRSSSALPEIDGAEFYSQISNVVEANDQFEYFFYIGNSSTPPPTLSHSMVH